MAGNLTEGMDTGRVREIAGQLTTQSGKIGEVAQNGTSQAGSLSENWNGSDSDQFQDSWQNAAKGLQAAQDSLAEYAKRAMQQADHQDDTSGS